MTCRKHTVCLLFISISTKESTKSVNTADNNATRTKEMEAKAEMGGFMLTSLKHASYAV